MKQSSAWILAGSIGCLILGSGYAYKQWLANAEPPVLHFQDVMDRVDNDRAEGSPHTWHGKAGQVISIHVHQPHLESQVRVFSQKPETMLSPIRYNLSTADAPAPIQAWVVAIPINSTYTITPRFYGMLPSSGNAEYSLTIQEAQEYEQLLLVADRHLAERQYDDAIATYTDAISLAPDIPELYLDRSGAYFEKGNAASHLDIIHDGPINVFQSFPIEIHDAIAQDWLTAADLAEQAGNQSLADTQRRLFSQYTGQPW